MQSHIVYKQHSVCFYIITVYIQNVKYAVYIIMCRQ